MAQVGYDMYCKLLDEVMKEMQGGKVQTEEKQEDIQIDLNVSSYIPDEYIESSDIKIGIYQDIALCKTEEEILDVTDEIIDRFGSIPKEVENLLEIARIKNLSKGKGITKIVQRPNGIVFYLSSTGLSEEGLKRVIETYKNKIKFSPSAIPYITYKIEENKSIIKQVKEFIKQI
ncbi:MAG: hypothetical protein HFJ52_07935 [Clostridia bacterium]|jgi:transcription-repair coupling factor (superfamily II helicase)|nr:hypothetical protein [Clostridia bacterium]